MKNEVKIIFFFVLIFAFSTNIKAQENINKVIKKTTVAMLKAKSGYFDMDYQIKHMDDKDTEFVNYKGYYKRKLLDRLGCKYFVSQYNDDTLFRQTVFDKQNYYFYHNGDTVIRCYNKEDAKFMNYQFSDFSFPIFANLQSLNLFTGITDVKQKEMSEETLFDTMLCYKISAYDVYENDTSEITSPIKEEKIFYIQKSSYLPIKIIQTYVEYDNSTKDTLYQTIISTIKDYKPSKRFEDEMFSIKSLPKGLTISMYSKQEEQKQEELRKPLSVNTIAPKFSVTTIEGKLLSLDSLKGKVVLIDFFYKACYPCMKAIPAMISLNEKYENQGLVVIGIDPEDNNINNEEFVSWIKKKGIKYRVARVERNGEIINNYNVNTYPTLYIIGKDGEIKYGEMGYNKDSENNIDKIIQQEIEKQ